MCRKVGAEETVNVSARQTVRFQRRVIIYGLCEWEHWSTISKYDYIQDTLYNHKQNVFKASSGHCEK